LDKPFTYGGRDLANGIHGYTYKGDLFI